MKGLGEDGVPLSEDQRKFRKSWTAEKCLGELRRIAEIDTRKVITRNYFRVHSDISESTWNRYFGTFEEYKRQAGITLSRHAHRLEKSIAKHASVGKMRDWNAEKKGWESRYLRPAGGRWQTALVVSDFHGLRCDPFVRRVFLDLVARVQPEKIILGGDMLDLAEFSKHTQDPRTFQVVQEIRWLHALLAETRAAAPEAEVTYIEGNHEFRLLRHTSEQSPAMLVVLADLHGMTVASLLGLEKYQVNYIARADLDAFTERDIKTQVGRNFVTLWDNALLFGHYPEMRSKGIPGASGHHHGHVVWSAYSPVHGPWEWHQIGAGHRRAASYTGGEKWGNGVLLAHCDTLTKRTQFDYIDLSHAGAFAGGKFYGRTVDEPVSDLGVPLCHAGAVSSSATTPRRKSTR